MKIGNCLEKWFIKVMIATKEISQKVAAVKYFTIVLNIKRDKL